MILGDNIYDKGNREEKEELQTEGSPSDFYGLLL